MFDRENVPVRFNTISPRKMERDEKEIGLLEVELEINPFTPELAKELDDFVRATLYTRTDAEVTRKLKGASFDITLQPQEIVVRMAPDQTDASFVIREAKVKKISARRSAKSAAWRLVFTMLCMPASEHQLAQIVDCYTKQRFLTFANAQPDLFSEVGKEERKTRKAAAAAGSGAAATAH